MTLLDEPRSQRTHAPEETDTTRQEDTNRQDTNRQEDTTQQGIDLTRDPIRTADGRTIDPRGRVAFRGMRIRRVRLKSVAKISFLFWLLGFAVLLGTVVAVWNVAQAFGYVDSFEETMITSLGLESFEIDGGGMFGVVTIGIAALCVLGWLTTLALAAVYNAACGVLGGLAVETGPLQRRRRVFSWRHRGFVTISE